MKTEQTTAKDTRERCVACGEETEYTFDTPIGERQFYIESAGQLCPKCHYDIYIYKRGGQR